MAHEKKTQFRDPHRWLVFGLLSSVYFFVYFQRVSTSVIATDLLVAFNSHWVGLTFGVYSLGTAEMIPLLLVMGGSMGGLGTVLWALLRETTPVPVLGLTTGFLNPSPFLGTAALQVWTGAILDHVGRVDGIYPLTAYRNAFLVCLVITASGLILCTTLRRRLSTSA